MPGCAIGRFESAAEYADNLRELAAVIIPLEMGPFRTSLLRVELPLTRLIDARETGTRTGYFSIPGGWCYAFFSISPDQPLFWTDETLKGDEIVLARDGERLRQSTIGDAHFGAIGIRSQTLQHYVEGLGDGLPAVCGKTSVVQMQAGLRRRLLRLHSRVVRMVESRPISVCHPETARAIEQEVIEVLVTCLLSGRVRGLTT